MYMRMTAAPCDEASSTEHRATPPRSLIRSDCHADPLTQRELCKRHADWLEANRPNVRSDPEA